MDQAIRILFVDDESNILNALQRVFIEEEYEILTATSGIEGMEILSDKSPVYVVVSDYRMPQMNGVAFLREVRAKWPETVRVVLSGYADTSAIVSAINDGQVYRFIPKPWDDDDLRMTIAAAVEQYRRQKKENLFADALQKRIEELERENTFLIKLAAGDQSSITAHEILDSLPVGVLMINRAGEIMHRNPEAAALLQSGETDQAPDISSARISGELRDLVDTAVSGGRCYARINIGGDTVHATIAITEKTGCDPFMVAVLSREEPDA
jgi:two-component system, NtrC family, sensor kinase